MLDRTQYIGSHDIACIMPDGMGGFLLPESAYGTAFTVYAHKIGIGNEFKPTLTTDLGLADEATILAHWWKQQDHYTAKMEREFAGKTYLGDRYELVSGLWWDVQYERLYDDPYFGGHIKGLKEPLPASVPMVGEVREQIDTDPCGDPIHECSIHIRSKTHPHAGCSPDALVYDNQEKRFVAVVDAKRANRWGWEKYEPFAAGGVPDNLKMQGDYLCAVSGLPVCHFAVLQAAHDTIHEFTHTPHEKHKQLLDVAEDFWAKYVETKTPPPSDGTPYKEFKPIADRMSEPEGEREATAEELDIRAQLDALQAEERECKQKIDALKVKARESLGDTKRAKGAFKVAKNGNLLMD